MATIPILSEEDLNRLPLDAREKYLLMQEIIRFIGPKCPDPQIAIRVLCFAIANILGRTWADQPNKLRPYVVNHLAKEVILQPAKLVLSLRAQEESKTATKQ